MELMIMRSTLWSRKPDAILFCCYRSRCQCSIFARTRCLRDYNKATEKGKQQELSNDLGAACMKSKQRDGAQRPKNCLSNQKFEPDSGAATARNLFQRTIKFCRKTSDSLRECGQNAKIELFSLIRIIVEARSPKKPLKWVQICPHFGTFLGAWQCTFFSSLSGNAFRV